MDGNNGAAVEKLIRKAYLMGQRDAANSLKENIDDLFEQIIEQANERIRAADND